MASKKSLEQRLKKIGKELAVLKKFRRSKKRNQFIRQLTSEQSSLKRQLSHLSIRPSVSKTATQKAANAARAGKLRKYHNYLRQIQSNYPDLIYAELRRQFSERKQGKHTKVPDVVWRNPSP